MENRFILKNGKGKSTLLDKKYINLLNNSLTAGNEATIERWERYNLIIEELLKDKKNNNLFNEIKYRLTDGEDANLVFLDILNKLDSTEETNLLHFLKRHIEEYIQEDYIAKFS